MNFFFDYIYYRLTQWKYKTQGDTSPTALGFISIMQTLIIESVINPMFKYFLTKESFAIHIKQLVWLAGIIVILLMFLNYRIYRGKFDEFQLHWQNESSNKRFFKGVLVILSLLSPILLFVLINNLTHK